MNTNTASTWKAVSPILVFIVVLVGLSPIPVQAQAGVKPVVRYATRSDTSGALRDIPQLPLRTTASGQVFERPRKMLPNRDANAGLFDADGALQASAPVMEAATVGANFEGINNLDVVLPPDTNGDIGPNHYVQMVNSRFAIFDRSGTLLLGPSAISTLWSGFGGPCEARDDGDPVVLYDHLADRWMMSQFALPNYPNGPFYQCIAVSKTPDPTGAWHRYQFKISDTKMNDYPKFGVWPDGYYMSVNQFLSDNSWAGGGAVVFERDKMLNGDPARMVYFDLYSQDPTLGGMLPADLDGPEPPAGAPNPFVQFDDNSWGYSPDQLQVWDFHVDWSNTANSAFTLDKVLGVSSFDSDMCAYHRNCIAQPGGTKLDALSDRLMFRLQYRNFGGYQTLVLNHTVDANGSDRAGVRWYELRNTGSSWGVHQQGTFSPDSANRWVGSIAMNGNGDIGLGYSVSSTSISPSIRFTGRLGGDPLNQMTFSEGTIANGSGFQTHSSGRWGDYAMLAVDPVDDCTFWFTTEYYDSISISGWQTRVGSFKLAECGPGRNLPPVLTQPDNKTSAEGDSVSLQIMATDPDGDPLTYGATNLPEGLSLDTSTGLISGTLSYNAHLGSPYSVTVTVGDGAGGSDSQAFSWSVSDVNASPRATNPGKQTDMAGDSISLQIQASDPDQGDVLAYSASGLPAGLKIGGSTGLIKGTLLDAAVGTHTVKVTVADGHGSSGSVSFSWVVNPLNHAPVAVSPGKQTDPEGKPISLKIKASDVEGDPFTYSAKGLPDGLAIGKTTGEIQGVLSFTAASKSPYHVTVTVKDDQGMASSISFTWVVEDRIPVFLPLLRR